MEEQLPASSIPSEQTLVVKTLVRQSGLAGKLIAEASESTARVYRVLSPSLPARLAAPTISRMMNGTGLKKLKRCNLLLLHLTIHCLLAREAGAGSPSQSAVEAASEFADAVLLAGGGSLDPSGGSLYDPNNPRHARAGDNFGDYAINLIERAVSNGDASSFRKLAVLQRLSGDADDARYWNNRAASAASVPPEVLDFSVAAQEAFAAGRWYVYNEKREVAEVYLALAAHAGHADAAFLLGDILEALLREDEAQRWFSVARSNGHSGAGKRVSAVQESK
ncbi:hypothetical protein [Actinomadura sp. CNU-125]|uniref:hypothetical protein n=1 Tax=Actinomadura sp. CNU-125 TaxID=1904961 RepID=UPI001178158F|nr:hypothetical protein [Actinomadura sp. CNU-125]